jgi:hypothetical protein
MAGEAPAHKEHSGQTDALAVGVDRDYLVEAPYDGVVSGASYTPAATITGADTNSRTLSVINKGQSGAGTNVAATLALTNGVNAPADDEKALALSGTPANLVVAAGDILVFRSLHVGTGIADPGGLFAIAFDKA